MKIIKSKNYRYKDFIKISVIDPELFHMKMENIKEAVHNGKNVYDAINNEFIGLKPDKIEQIKDFVSGALYQGT